jgi:hypothetical protein
MTININEIISYIEKTDEDSWQTEICRSKDDHKNCFLGHLFNLGGNDLINEFEWIWATEFMYFPINDGEDKRYKQSTPKQRIIAYLIDLKDGKTKTTQDILKEYEEEI